VVLACHVLRFGVKVVRKKSIVIQTRVGGWRNFSNHWNKAEELGVGEGVEHTGR
jgi:hypothetical protein